MEGARAALVAAVLVGLAAGLGLYTFVYGKGASYLSTDPGVCANCHIMQEHFDAWQRSSHRVAARCALIQRESRDPDLALQERLQPDPGTDPP